MGLLFVPELFFRSAPGTADSTLQLDLLAPEFGLWVLLSGKPTLLPSSQVEWSKVPWIWPLSTTIWNPSTASRIATEWISSLEAYPAKVPLSQGSARASRTSAGSGRSSGKSSKTRTRRGYSSRTSPGSFPLTVVEHSRKSSGTWARAGGMQSGTVSPRDPLAPRTSAIVSSCSLPTPTASQYGSSQNGVNEVNGVNGRPSSGTKSLFQRAQHGLLPTPLAMSGEQRGGRANARSGRTLTEEARKLPTPRASDSTKGSFDARDRPEHNGPTLPEEIQRLAKRGLLPTPTATDAKASGVAGNWTKLSGRHAGATLTDVAVRKLESGMSSESCSTLGEPTGSGGGRLSQRFVAWMMGLPTSWTEV